MPMQFSNFPYLVQKEIFNHLSLNSIFFLSLCSKKMKDSIIRVQKIRFKTLERITYNLHFREIVIHNSVEALPDCVLRFFGKPLTETDEIVKVNIEGKLIRFCRSPEANLSQLYGLLECGEEESIYEAIHNNLHDLFGSYAALWMQTSYSSRRFPILKCISGIEIVSMGENLEPERIDDCLSASPSLQCFE